MKKILIIFYIILLIFIMGLYGETAGSEKEVKSIVKAISPSVVKVIAQDGRRYIASGIVIGRDLVISNAKVADHPFRKILIFTHNGKTYDAKVVGKDRKTSIILLKTAGKYFLPVKSGSVPEVGDWVGLVGVFYRDFPFIKSGIVSSVNENEMILNASVMPGTTGGAVVNRRGEFVGMIRGMLGFQNFPQYIFKDNSGELKIIPTKNPRPDQCYVLPVNRVRKVVRELKSFGYVRRGWLGVNISNDIGSNVRVANVEKNSPAEKWGLKKNDIIVKIDGVGIKRPIILANMISNKIPGEKVNFIVKRRGKSIPLPVTLGDFRDRKIAEKSGSFFSFGNRVPVAPELVESLPTLKNYVYRITGHVSLGADLVPLTPELAKEFGIVEKGGLLVSKIKNRNLLDSGLKVGDILIRAGEKMIKSPEDLKNVLYSDKNNNLIKIEYYRKGKLRTVRIKPEVMSEKDSIFKDFKKKLIEMRFWMEQSEKRNLKLKLEKLKALEKNRLRQVYEKEKITKEHMEIEKEKEMLRKEYLQRIKGELKRLNLEKKRMEKELKKKKEKKKKENDG